MNQYGGCTENTDSACGSPEKYNAMPCSGNTPKCNIYTG